MKHVIFYYTGTGNSLRMVNEIRALSPEATAIRLPLENQALPISDADTAGLIFPVYAYGPPVPVAQFIESGFFPHARYTYAVAVHGGGPANALSNLKTLFQKHNYTIDAGFELRMPSNYITGANPGPEEKIQRIINHSKTDISGIARQIIENQQVTIKKKRTPLANLKSGLINRLFNAHRMKQGKKFSVLSTCDSCAVCTKVCPAKNIKLDESGKPQWADHCEYCLACINLCPKAAINSGTLTKKRFRYRNPEILLRDLFLR